MKKLILLTLLLIALPCRAATMDEMRQQNLQRQQEQESYQRYQYNQLVRTPVLTPAQRAMINHNNHIKINSTQGVVYNPDGTLYIKPTPEQLQKQTQQAQQQQQLKEQQQLQSQQQQYQQYQQQSQQQQIIQQQEQIIQQQQQQQNDTYHKTGQKLQQVQASVQNGMSLLNTGAGVVRFFKTGY